MVKKSPTKQLNFEHSGPNRKKSKMFLIKHVVHFAQNFGKILQKFLKFEKDLFLPASTRSVPPGIHFALLLLLLLLGRPLIKLGTISADS
jgi:hypothetical protein